MEVRPMTLRAARAYVAENHRHHKAPQGGLWAVGCEHEGKLIGCAIVGMPVARMLADGKTVEITRMCTDGTRNACSFLYRVCVRIANAMGYRRVLTYTLAEEGGASLRGAGFKLVSETKGGSWSRPSRGRTDKHPLQAKFRWEVAVINTPICSKCGQIWKLHASEKQGGATVWYCPPPIPDPRCPTEDCQNFVESSENYCSDCLDVQELSHMTHPTSKAVTAAKGET